MRDSPLVVAISGTSGAGKSTVVDGLASALIRSGLLATALHFDDYADAARLPDDLSEWLERGADPAAWRADRLELELVTRLADSEPGTVIIVEEPFGRARSPMRDRFDLAIHIDLPLGVALARRLLRDFVPSSGGLDEPGSDRLRDYLALYLRGGAAAYQAIDQMARGASDVVLDGSADRSELVDRAALQVHRRMTAG